MPFSNEQWGTLVRSGRSKRWVWYRLPLLIVFSTMLSLVALIPLHHTLVSASKLSEFDTVLPGRHAWILFVDPPICCVCIEQESWSVERCCLVGVDTSTGRVRWNFQYNGSLCAWAVSRDKNLLFIVTAVSHKTHVSATIHTLRYTTGVLLSRACSALVHKCYHCPPYWALLLIKDRLVLTVWDNYEYVCKICIFDTTLRKLNEYVVSIAGIPFVRVVDRFIDIYFDTNDRILAYRVDVLSPSTVCAIIDNLTFPSYMFPAMYPPPSWPVVYVDAYRAVVGGETRIVLLDLQANESLSIVSVNGSNIRNVLVVDDLVCIVTLQALYLYNYKTRSLEQIDLNATIANAIGANHTLYVAYYLENQTYPVLTAFRVQDRKPYLVQLWSSPLGVKGIRLILSLSKTFVYIKNLTYIPGPPPTLEAHSIQNGELAIRLHGWWSPVSQRSLHPEALYTYWMPHVCSDLLYLRFVSDVISRFVYGKAIVLSTEGVVWNSTQAGITNLCDATLAKDYVLLTHYDQSIEFAILSSRRICQNEINNSTTL